MLVMLAIAALAMPACAPPFPKDLLDKVEKNVSFSDLFKDPEPYRGKLLLLGGIIVETKNLKEGTQIEVLQKALDNESRPYMTDETAGRFLIVSSQFIDAAVYQRGRQITVLGEAAGSKTQQLGEAEYRYPVITAKDLHLWAPYSGPRFSIGIGVFKGY